MAISPLGVFPDFSKIPVQQPVNPLELLIKGFEQGQRLKQDALNQELQQALMQAKLQAIPLQQAQQEFQLRELQAQLAPDYKARQQEAQLTFDVQRARALGEVEREFAKPLATPKVVAQVEGDFIVRRDPISLIEIGRDPIQKEKGKRFVDRGVLGAGYVDEVTEKFIPIEGTVPQAGGRVVTPVTNPLTGENMGFDINGKFQSNKDLEPAPKTAKPRTEMQAKAKVSAEQAANAVSKLDKLTVDPTYFVPGAFERLKSDKRKQFEQAAEEFTEAALRFKTGASVTKEETRNALRIWIEQPGDDVTTIANKKASRELLINEMMGAAGGDSSPSPVSSGQKTTRSGIKYTVD